MHKWRPKQFSFVYVLISLTSLVSTDKIQKKSSFRMRLVGLISTKTKEYLFVRHFCIRSMTQLEQPRRQQEGDHKFAHLTMKNNTFARFARAFVIFGHFADLLVLSKTWNDQSNCVKKKMLEYDWLLTAFIHGLIGFFTSKLSHLTFPITNICN